LAKKLAQEKAAKAKARAKKYANVLTEQEAACYSSRYSDLGKMTPGEHYATIGKKQGRHVQCENFMTYFQAERYLLRYSDLGKKYGTHGVTAFKKARHHWFETGSKQTPKLNIGVNYETEKPFKCGDYGQECVCPGRIHLGPKKRLDNNDTIDNLFEMLDFAQAS